MKSWRFFILAGGLGTRALPLSSVRAKPAFPLASVPLIRRMAEQIVKGDPAIESGWVNLHHLPETVMSVLRPDCSVEFLHEPVLTGSRILTRSLEDPDWTYLLVVNGDLYCRLPVQRLISESRGRDALLLLRSPDSGTAYRSIDIQDGRFLRRKAPGEPGLMYTGACVLSRRAVSFIRSENFFDDFERENLDIGCCFYSKLWLDFGNPRIYHRANLAFLKEEGLPPAALWDPSARIDGDPASVCRSVLWPGVRIKSDTRLVDCVVCDRVEPEAGGWREGVWTPDGFYPF